MVGHNVCLTQAGAIGKSLTLAPVVLAMAFAGAGRHSCGQLAATISGNIQTSSV